jgi:RNA recognition motif-containing protein
LSLLIPIQKGGKYLFGKIDLLKTFSFFEVEAEYANDLIAALNDTTFMDRRVAVEIAQEKSDKPRGEYPAKKPAKWADRRPEKRRSDRPDRKTRDYSSDSKSSRKGKKNYSR